jgi:hypothetical protein
MEGPFTKGFFSFSPAYRAVDWAVAKRSRNTIRCEDGSPHGTGVVGEQVCQISESRGAPKGSVLLDFSPPTPRKKKETLGMANDIKRNQPLKLDDDYYTGILKNAVT